VNKNNGHALCYSTAPAPLGPFTYQGVLVSLGRDNENQVHSTAYGGNTHGGIFTVNGRWFVNYHRQTGDFFPARQSCMAELTMTANGRFLQAPFSTQVERTGELMPGAKIPAYSACVLTDRRGRTKKHTQSPYFTMRGPNLAAEGIQQAVTGLSGGCSVGFKYFNFGTVEKIWQAGVLLKNAKKGRIDIFIDTGTWENKICIIPVRENRMIPLWIFGATVPVFGIHTLLFCFYGQGKTTNFISFIVAKGERI
jgi:hypothetical protein